MKTFIESEIIEILAVKLKDWQLDGNSIKRDFRFKSFVEAFSFMTSVALKAEKLNHHPDWSNVYNNVYIRLNTHDSNGITELDFELANTIDGIFKNFQNNV